MRFFYLAFVLSALTPACAFGQPKDDAKSAEFNKQLNEQFSRGTKRALLIGIDKYKPPQRSTESCVKSIQLLADALERFGGYKRANISFLLDKDADKKSIVKKLEELIDASQEDDVLFFGFCGRGYGVGGTEADKRGFYLADTDYELAQFESWKVVEVVKVLERKRRAQTVFFLDSCPEAPFKAGQPLEPACHVLAESFKKATGTITYTSCRQGQVSVIHQQHSVFTSLFVRGLSGDADLDKNGIVDSDEIDFYMLKELSPTVRSLNPDREQIPGRIIGEGVSGAFPLAKLDGKPFVLPVKFPARPEVGDVVENSVGMKLIFLPVQPVVIGSPKTEYLRNDDEAQQPILINAPIYMGVHEVTQAQYEKVMGKNPSYYSAGGDGADAVATLKTGNFPVEQVTWNDAVEFCKKLSALPEEKKARRAYRLPTEGEWEYACRAGKQTTFATGDKISSKQANIRGDKPYLDSEEGPTLGRPTAVGSYKPNAFGLHDMHGNVAEWCQDFYASRPYLTFAAAGDFKSFYDLIQTQINDQEASSRLHTPINPTGPKEGTTRVYRGGAFVGDVTFTRSACRRDKDPDYRYRGIGFRVVCYLVPN